MTYRRKHTVEAMQWDGKSFAEMARFLYGPYGESAKHLVESERFYIRTPCGMAKPRVGDFVIKSNDGQFDLYSPEIFYDEFEPT